MIQTTTKADQCGHKVSCYYLSNKCLAYKIQYAVLTKICYQIGTIFFSVGLKIEHEFSALEYIKKKVFSSGRQIRIVGASTVS